MKLISYVERYKYSNYSSLKEVFGFNCVIVFITFASVCGAFLGAMLLSILDFTYLVFTKS